MFNVGQLIMYSKTGVCQVQEIGKIDMTYMDKDRDYYTLKPCFENGMVYVPVDTELPMREIMTKDEAEATILKIPRIKVSRVRGNRTIDLKALFNEKLNSQDVEELIAIVKTLSQKSKRAKKEGKTISITDQNYLKLAEKLFYGELAAALGIDYDEVMPYIEKKLAAEKNKNAAE